jgi:glutaryl-CoA dehydrogenase
MDSYRAVDFYQVDELLNPEERTLRATVRSWASERVIPEAAAWVEQAHFPRELVGEMGQLGYLGPSGEIAGFAASLRCRGRW